MSNTKNPPTSEDAMNDEVQLPHADVLLNHTYSHRESKALPGQCRECEAAWPCWYVHIRETINGLTKQVSSLTEAQVRPESELREARVSALEEAAALGDTLLLHAPSQAAFNAVENYTAGIRRLQTEPGPHATGLDLTTTETESSQ